MITILTWTSIIAGGILVLLLLLSILGGLDMDIDIGGDDADTSEGGLGIIKGLLTFVSVGAWMMRILLIGDQHPGLALAIGVVAGLVALFLLNYLLRVLLSNEENVNWEMDDALFQTGEVYLKVPAKDGSGIVNVDVKGASRELKARSRNGELPTGTSIRVVDIDGEYVIVSKDNK